MFIRLLLLFTVIPIVELALLIKIGEYIGTLYTIAIVILTGVIGASLARSQGISILNKIRYELYEGRVPGEEIINGLCVLVGGIMLVTPGLITDTVGFLFIIPVTRNTIKVWLKHKLHDMIQKGSINVYFRK
jgi:UPF0716 protein FxsA